MLRTLLDCDIHKHLATYQNAGSVIAIGNAITGLVVEGIEPIRDMGDIITKQTTRNLSLFLWRKISRCVALRANENTANLICLGLWVCPDWQIL